MNNPESISTSWRDSREHSQRANELLMELDSSPLATGKKHLRNYLQGKRIIRSQAIEAKCYDCSCYYIDGRVDCEVHTCPLYPFMPYGKLKKSKEK